MLGMSDDVLPAFAVMNLCASSSAALALSFTLTVRQRSRNVLRSPLKLSVWKRFRVHGSNVGQNWYNLSLQQRVSNKVTFGRGFPFFEMMYMACMGVLSM